MACSICKQDGHNKSSCKDAVKAVKAAKTVKAPKEKKKDVKAVSDKPVKVTTEKAEKAEKIQTTKKAPSMAHLIEQVTNYIAKNTSKEIILLRNKEVIQWLFGDLSFLTELAPECKTKKNMEDECKKLEDKWGQNILKTLKRPDLKLDKQWTNKFGEHLGEELYTLIGKTVTKPALKENKQPDLETEDFIVEVKAQTYFTSGTAGEKILGVPFKYAEIPDLYGKPLKIVCMGGAEKVCREQYGNLAGPKCSPQKKKLLEFFKSMGIEYVAATDILIEVSNSTQTSN